MISTGDQSYSRFKAYSQSKLANLLFACELDQKLRGIGSPVLSICAHPGTVRTNLGTTGFKMESDRGIMKQISSSLKRAVFYLIFSPLTLFIQSPDDGVLPLLYAATSPNAESGAYYGPGGSGERKGAPRRVESSEASYDQNVARRLWEVSSELTRVRFNL